MNPTSARSGLALIAALLLATLGAYAAYALPLDRRGPAPAAARAAATKPGPLAAAVQAAQRPGAAGDVLQALVQGLPRLGTDDGTIQLSVRADRSALLRGGDGELHVEVELSAKEQQRGMPHVLPPSDVLVVLDTSGSMEGEKLGAAKQALRTLLDRMQSTDRIGLVTYADDARLVIGLSRASEGLRAQLNSVIDGLSAVGGTNISAGLDLALSQLPRSGDARSARVLLLSDGHANNGDFTLAGLQHRARKLARAEHVLSTLGIGDDFNEDLMASLADVGTGNFFYLSRVEVLEQFVAAELGAGRVPPAARALALRFEMAPGVKLLDASGYPLDYEHGARIVRPGSLYPGQKRSLWLTIKAPVEELTAVPLGRFALHYKHARGAEEQRIEAAPLPLLAVVDDAARFERGIDRELWQRYVLEAQRHQIGLQLGAAVGNGTAADVDEAVHAFEKNRALAERLGSDDVLAGLDDVRAAAAASKLEQQGSAASRSYNAKQRKARALYNVRPNSSLLSNPYDAL